MDQKTKRIAVLGGGLSGIASAKHLKAAGLEVVVFERSKNPGGLWCYDDQRPPSPTYPAENPSVADSYYLLDREELGKGSNRDQLRIAEIELLFAPPGPAYNGLESNNVVGPFNEMKGHPWKKGIGEHVNVRIVLEYLNSYVKAFEVDRLIKYNTRVDKLLKKGDIWEVEFSTLVTDGSERGNMFQGIEQFDAVVVATGHYHSPRIPDIPGLKEWKRTWPNRLDHSKSYRRPEMFEGKTVLLIGAAISSMDVAKELAPFAKHIYQSNREGALGLPPGMLPKNSERVTGVVSFGPPPDNLEVGQSILGAVTLADGRIISDVDHVMFCTGYHFSYPFLSAYHNDSMEVKDADQSVLVTEGTQIHNLHRDIFYIPDPTLAFVGIPTFTASFTFFEFQAIAVAAVFSGKAWLPSESEMRGEYQERTKTKPPGRAFHSMLNFQVNLEAAYVKSLVDWLNDNAKVTGGEQVEGHSEVWHDAYDRQMENLRAMFTRK